VKNYAETLYDRIRAEVKNRKVFCLVSGGVDSTVTFALLEKALGAQRVYGLFVNTGLLRANEAQDVEQSLKKAGFKNFHVQDASKEFFKALAGVTEPEKKRKIIGDTFLEVQKKVAKQLKLSPSEWMLAQGTIYPDTIESGGTKHADKIKTHHNRVPQIEALIKKGLLIEPLKEFYKDEVRTIGEKIGVEKNLVWRHPFPGPGLAVRCLCAKKPFLPTTVKAAEKKLATFLSKYKLKGKILPVQSVGVQGDNRTYRNPVVITGEASWETLQDIATKIPNQFKEISRVVLSITPEEITSVEFSKATLTPERIALLQQADRVVMKFLDDKKLMRAVWQFPVVLLPISLNKKAGETIVLRPVCSEEAMTAAPYFFEWPMLRKLTDELMKIKGISGVLYDVTTKPPATIEWE
jgi:GMP synthase (glutamine-hydrolysing)